MDDRILVQRANVILEVKAEDKAFYMQNGYSVIDKNGNVVEKAMSNNVNELRVQVKELTEQVKELTEQLAQANATIAELRKAQETPVEVVPEKKTRRTRA